MVELDTERTHRLGSRAFFLFLGNGVIVGALLLGGIFATWWYCSRYIPRDYIIYYNYGLQMAALFVLAYMAYKFALAFLAYRAHEYRFDDEYFHIVKGYLNRNETGVVYHRIQTVSVERPVMARVVGVAHLTIHSGGGGSDKMHEVLLPALDLHKARQVQKELLSRSRMGQHGKSSRPQYRPVPFEEEDYEDED